MPRKLFLADLKDVQLSPLPGNFRSLHAGLDDGQLELLWKAADVEISITVIVSEVSAYPTAHEYMIFCTDDATSEVAKTLYDIQGTSRKTILQLLECLASELGRSSIQQNPEDERLIQDFDDTMQDEDISEDDGEEEDDDDFLTAALAQRPSIQFTELCALPPHEVTPNTADESFNARLRTDLQAVKDAGFRLGVIGDINNGSAGFLAISVRISQLGLSGEAMQAWQVQPSEYLLLLIFYPHSYAIIEQLQSSHDAKTTPPCSMRLFSSKTYKPSRDEAVAAFQRTAAVDRSTSFTAEQPKHGETTTNLRMTFLSRPFIRLLNEDLIPLIKHRGLGMDWAGAEAWLRDREASMNSSSIPEEYFEAERIKAHHPTMVTADHWTDSEPGLRSFPLVAMQFTLRHFVRCTEFCVVCHRKVSAEIEAMKPYVCDQPLCLFQYMAMGFGPSIEHEILSQPYVVDLLVSFCYAAATQRKLKDLPIGLGIKVPSSKAISDPLPRLGYGASIACVNTLDDIGPDFEEFDVGFDRTRQEIQFLDRPKGGCPVIRGSWIVIRIGSARSNGHEVLHCRVSETTFFPIIRVDKPVHVAVVVGNNHVDHRPETPEDQIDPIRSMTRPNWMPCTLRRHDIEFDGLTREQKCDAICQVLNVLPSVHEMRAYLRASPTRDLKRWVERIPASALQLLQWIIASNRACLMQVDDQIPGEMPDQPTNGRKQERLHGMTGYMQFRFAMGAPDKEERFLSEVKNTTRRLKLRYPTIFAWHGSPVHNWHMIIREGLHYQNRDHGRAYGDGVYHALNAHTSLGFCARGGTSSWPNSVLKVSGALALNELVNAPAEFKSSRPYYVIQQLDWIQTRYLLVRCDTGTTVAPKEAFQKLELDRAHPQDPERTPNGIDGPIIIPASAVKTGAGNDINASDSPAKRLKSNSGGVTMMDLDSDLDSVQSDDEDFAPLTTNGSTASRAEPNKHKSMSVVKKCAKVAISDDDFTPGELDFNTLPLMPFPAYAVSATTQRLMREVRSLQTALDTTPLCELGWYMDTSSLDNVYQWIVELHSFHMFEAQGRPLPLVSDMKLKKIKSIVLEVRFGSDYPFSPPYVRVVRPRFLGFNQGGGGHVVMGGAMCMEMLTNTGWIAASTMESVLMQVRLAMASEPFARLDLHSRGDYTVGEAANGFIRACRAHGWVEPPGFKEIAFGTPAAAGL